MGTIKQRVISQYGKGDNLDERRWESACRIAQKTDCHVGRCFQALVSLEKKGMIQIISCKFERNKP